MYVLDAKDIIIKVWMEVYACIVWIFFPHMCCQNLEIMEGRGVWSIRHIDKWNINIEKKKSEVWQVWRLALAFAELMLIAHFFLQFVCLSCDMCLAKRFRWAPLAVGGLDLRIQQRRRKKYFLQRIPFFFLHLSLPSKLHTFQKKNLCDDIEACLLYTYLAEPPFSGPTPFRKKLITETKSFLEMSLKGTFSNFIRFHNLLSTQHIFT